MTLIAPSVAPVDAFGMLSTVPASRPLQYRLSPESHVRLVRHMPEQYRHMAITCRGARHAWGTRFRGRERV